MKKISRHKFNLFSFALILSVLFVVGIICVSIFASKSKIIMGVSIAFIVLGFYGSPLLWLKFSKSKKDAMIIQSIKNDKIYAVSALCNLYNTSEKQMRGIIKELITKRFLEGYILEENTVRVNKAKDSTLKKGVKCQYCGATVFLEDNEGNCAFCNNFIRVS